MKKTLFVMMAYYLQSASYRDVLDRHYGTCSSTIRSNETEGS